VGAVRTGIAALIAAAALLGCTQRSETSVSAAATADAGGYTLDVFAHEGERIYLVRDPEGRTAAARANEAGSAMMAAEEAQSLMPQALARTAPEDARISIRAPGFSLQINADETAPGEDGRARIDINAGGHRVFVDAEGEGDAGRAVVHIAGADADAARDFIAEAEGLSDETRAAMRAALGL
jgi:hypothetical protein